MVFHSFAIVRKLYVTLYPLILINYILKFIDEQKFLYIFNHKYKI
jgi:hypothetical protein